MKKDMLLVMSCLGIALLLSVMPVQAIGPTTEVHVVKYAPDGETILNETNVTYQWMRDNLPVLGDGVTHYYHQGPVFFDYNDPWNPDPWNPAEDINVKSWDFGPVKGTDIKDLCDLVGGMSPGDEVKISATGDFDRWFHYTNDRWFNYTNVYNNRDNETLNSRQGSMALCWYNGGGWYNGEESITSEPQGAGYPDTGYFTGMRLIFFADNSTNPWGYHVFGNWDMHECMDEEYWHYYDGCLGFDGYPSSSGLSVKWVSDIIIYSNESPSDTTTPTISITYPASGQVFSTDTITVNGTASDNIALSKVEVKLNSGSWQTATGTTSWSQSVTLANGSNTIYARATDTSYNTGETSITVTYNPPSDTTPPTISITCPASGQVFSTSTITVTGTASDNIALSKVEVKLGSGSWQTASGTTSWSQSVTLANGSNTIYARATDTSENTNETSVTVTYNPPDTTTPTISITYPASGQVFSTDTITVNGTASDNIALSKVEVKLNSGSWQTATGTTSWSKSVTLAEGSNTIYARATDTSENTNETSITVTYNPPDIQGLCGDVNNDGVVDVLDATKVNNRAGNPNYPLDDEWAADVNCDGIINVLDATKVKNRAGNPSYPLSCCTGYSPFCILIGGAYCCT
ncbi:MAG: Ig-like domain-containing protein [Methanocellales archaeon]|nr:Ig-like domain-containing protein [Methanocellales archaeon]MDD3292454.1 Ig-like domain-containing protein [Methanocellales archaeon]MDD5485922.1 Ig-like domain-containing protein [Methanocellales archaeon]